MADKLQFRSEDLEAIASRVANDLKQSEHKAVTTLRMKQQALRKRYAVVLALLATVSLILGGGILAIGPSLVSPSTAENFAGIFLETALGLCFAAIFAFWYDRGMAKIDDSVDVVRALANATPEFDVKGATIEIIYSQTERGRRRAKDEAASARDLEANLNTSQFEIEDDA